MERVIQAAVSLLTLATIFIVWDSCADESYEEYTGFEFEVQPLVPTLREFECAGPGVFDLDDPRRVPMGSVVMSPSRCSEPEGVLGDQP